VLSIRPYAREDFSQLHRIDQLCFAPDVAYSRAELRFYIEHRGAFTRVAELDGTIAGFVVARSAGERGHILTLDVVEAARRRGVGRALMDAVDGELARRGVAQIFLEVDVANTGARLFYERLGYRALGILKGYYNGRSDAVQMVRVTSP
jgi:[ribosomal protein S18]-alanine N-acetyltransferase